MVYLFPDVLLVVYTAFNKTTYFLGFSTLTDLFAIIKEAIREKAQERIAGN